MKAQRVRHRFALPLLAFALTLRAAASQPEVETAPLPPEPIPFSWREAIVLGVVEGITEFLPVSSTGHLIIANRILGLDSPAAEAIQTGDFSLAAAANAYAVIIQAGAIAAVLLLYRGEVSRMLRGVLGRDRRGLQLFRNLFLALLPAVALGLLLEAWIDTHLFSVEAVLLALVAGAILMLVVERRRRRSPLPHGQPDLHPADLSVRQALIVGLMQCLALWPGTSRSMVTIVGGYLAGLGPVRAAEFSFLLGVPTLTGAALLKAVRSGGPMVELLGWGPLLLGCAVAALSAAIAVRFLVSFLAKHSLAPFAYYRVLLAVVLALALVV